MARDIDHEATLWVSESEDGLNTSNELRAPPQTGPKQCNISRDLPVNHAVRRGAFRRERRPQCRTKSSRLLTHSSMPTPMQGVFFVI